MNLLSIIALTTKINCCCHCLNMVCFLEKRLSFVDSFIIHMCWVIEFSMWKVCFLSLNKVTVSNIGLIKISLEYFNFNVTIISSFLFLIQHKNFHSPLRYGIWFRTKKSLVINHVGPVYVVRHWLRVYSLVYEQPCLVLVCLFILNIEVGNS